MEEVWNHQTKTSPTRAGLPAKLSNWVEKGLGQEGDLEPDGHSERVPEFLCGDRRTFQSEVQSTLEHVFIKDLSVLGSVHLCLDPY